MGKRPNGFGKMFKEYDNVYIGYFDHGRAHGKGVFLFSDGSYYSGDFYRNSADT